MIRVNFSYYKVLHSMSGSIFQEYQLIRVFLDPSEYMKKIWFAIFGTNFYYLWHVREWFFGQFWGEKGGFLNFLKIVLELLRECYGIVFWLKVPIFWCIFSLKGWIWPTNRIFWSTFSLRDFDNLRAQKSRFLDFF